MNVFRDPCAIIADRSYDKACGFVDQHHFCLGQCANMGKYNSLLGEQYRPVSEDANLYTLSATLGFKICHSILIASTNNSPPIILQ